MLSAWRRRRRQRLRARSRPFGLEPLESRVLLSGVEGLVPPEPPPFRITIDYRFDDQRFFDPVANLERRATLERAAATIGARLTDDLFAITPTPMPDGSGNTWTAQFTDPADLLAFEQVENLSVGAGELIVFAGGQDLDGVLGLGGPGGIASASGTQEWIDTLWMRGEPGSATGVNTDYGPWGGAITFDSTAAWHFGETTEGLDATEYDFYSVALHELTHMLGFGTAPSWTHWVDAANHVFTGPRSLAEYDGDGNVPTNLDGDHWADGTMDEHHETAMDPTIGPDRRKRLTPLDFAGLADVGWQVTPPAVLQVISVTNDASGFDVEMSAGFVESLVNLYDTQTAALGAADVTLVGQTRGNVSGSLVVDGIAGTLRFVATGGPLAPDTYTVTLRSAADGFKDREGRLLDGDDDGAAGGYWVQTFLVAATPARLVSIGDVVRGPGQPVNVPATSSALPIRLSDGNGVTSVEVTFHYDPTVFTPTYAFPDGLPGDTTLSTGLGIVNAHHVLTHLRLTIPAPLGAGPVDLVNVVATIPATAPYGITSLLVLDNVIVNSTPVGDADSAVLVVAYFGDATGNRTLSSLDAQRTLRVARGLDTGFAAFRFVDPVLIADITSSGGLDATDATRVLQEVVGLDRLEIPAIPPPPEPSGAVAFASAVAPLQPSAQQPALPPLVDVSTSLSWVAGFGAPAPTASAPVLPDAMATVPPGTTSIRWEWAIADSSSLPVSDALLAALGDELDDSLDSHDGR